MVLALSGSKHADVFHLDHLRAAQAAVTSAGDLARAWQALAEVEAQTGQPFHTVLRLRVDQPELRSPEMAEQLTRRFGKPVSAAGLRQTLHRARERFADLLLDEVVQTLGKSAEYGLEQELIELNLLTYCQPALDRRKANTPEGDKE